MPSTRDVAVLGVPRMMDSPETPDDDPGAEIAAANAALAEWAARLAAESDALIARFEAMGYAVRGKSEAEVAEILRHPPSQTPS